MSRFSEQGQEGLLAWARYLYWCDLHRRRLEHYDGATEDGASDSSQWHFIALIAQWYASLWVVVEGWQKLRKPDSNIRDLLESCPRYCDLMKRFRNGVYHYQPSLVDSRLLAFLQESDVTYIWGYLLHGEFCRFFWEWIHQSPDDLMQKEYRERVLAIVGWIPEDTTQEHIRISNVLRRRALHLLETTNDALSPAANDLLISTRHLYEVERQGEEGLEHWRRQLIAVVKERGFYAH